MPVGTAPTITSMAIINNEAGEYAASGSSPAEVKEMEWKSREIASLDKGASVAFDSDRSERLASKINSRDAIVAVVGLGYVGLPLALRIAEAGFAVHGYDTNADKVNFVNSGCSHLDEIENSRIKSVVDGGKLKTGASGEILVDADVIIICVPTPLTPQQVPDITYIREAGHLVAEKMNPGTLVILESTTYPGCTREALLPVLEKQGFKAGRDFWLAFAPERVDPGSKKYDIGNTPRLVGGLTKECGDIATYFYAQFVETVIRLSSSETAEMAKLLENIYRSVNIALVNEMAMICNSMGISVWEVVGAAATKPFGFVPFYPGPGLGGHCIPVDPFYLAWKARELDIATEFIELAGKVNSRMPGYVVERINVALNSHSKCLRDSHVLLIGVSYKEDIPDIRESPALKVAGLLIQGGADVAYHDPLVPSLKLNGHPISSCSLDTKTLNDADCVVVLTAHSRVDWDKVGSESRLIVDTRNAVPSEHQEKIFSI